MKSFSFITVLLIIAMMLSACGQQSEAIGFGPTIDSTEVTNEPDPQSDPVKERIAQRCEEISALYYDLYKSADKTEPQHEWDVPVLSQTSIDAIENLLIDAGLDVVDTHGTYPSYLTTADRFNAFLESVTRKETAQQEVISILESGALSYSFFTSSGGDVYFYCMGYSFDEAETYYEKHEIQEWALTDRGNFYYRIYPAGDKHYADFSLIRLTAPDSELCDLTRKYIMAGGYIATNIFLTDWTENDFGNLSFNDLWEYLYYDCYGEQFRANGYDDIPERNCYKIPASEFEKVVLPYFDIDIDTFRELAQYEAEGQYYPWRQIQTNDYEFINYYVVEPEVTAYTVNSDGTITLTVEMLSTDLKTDCLFAHEVTVRPLENGKFQYVSNRVTVQTEYGLPYCEPRLTWGISG